jgi:hypothetical protein
MMKRHVSSQWRLREVMATHGMFTITEVVPLLVDRGITLSVSQVHRLATGTPNACHGRCSPRRATSSTPPRAS